MFVVVIILQARFSTNWRAQNNQSYQTLLHQIGTGEMQDVMIPADSMCSDIPELIHRTYGNNIISADNDTNMILAFRLEDVTTVNDLVMNMIQSPTQIVLASDSFAVDHHNLPSEYIASLSIPGAPAFAIPIKIGARYMIIKNISTGIVNGTLCKVVSFSDHVVHVQLLSGSKRKSVVMLPRCTFNVLPEASGLPYAFTRTQFPIQVAYCVTVRRM